MYALSHVHIHHPVYRVVLPQVMFETMYGQDYERKDVIRMWDGLLVGTLHKMSLFPFAHKMCLFRPAYWSDRFRGCMRHPWAEDLAECFCFCGARRRYAVYRRPQLSRERIGIALDHFCGAWNRGRCKFFRKSPLSYSCSNISQGIGGVYSATYATALEEFNNIAHKRNRGSIIFCGRDFVADLHCFSVYSLV